MNSDTHFLDGGVASPQGFQSFSARAGLKTSGDDIVLVISDSPATSAGVFTQNRVKAAPVLLCAEHLQNETARAIVANAGNANCCTGEQGMSDTRAMCEIVAREIGCAAHEILVCSTGIIGHALPMEKLAPALQSLARKSTPENGRTFETNEAAARAFMTTDTRPKFFAAQAKFDGKIVTIGGQAKGAGMIAPEMAALNGSDLHATMLCFLTTDARIEKSLLQSALEKSVERSLNSTTIDGDTSTNDSCLILANGASGVEITEENFVPFCALLESVCVALAKEIARDGEGATKLVTVEIAGAKNEADAKSIAMTVANSPLVKTAIFGRDPNWGRICAAAGRAGIAFDAAKLGVQIGAVEVFREGEPTAFSLADAEAAMSENELTIRVTLGEGNAKWTAWTCDFSYDYVKINAEYHT